MRAGSSTLIAGFLLLSAASAQPRVEVSATPSGEQYRLRDNGAEAVLIAGSKAPSYRVRITGTREPARQFRLLGELIGAAWARNPPPERFSFAMAAYREPIEFLAKTTACANDWNGARGQPAKGSIGAYLTNLLRDSQAHPALTEFFRQRGYRIAAVGVEQILTARCAQPFCAVSCVGAARRQVPSSALIEFEASK